MTIITHNYETCTLERSVYINETFKLPPQPLLSNRICALYTRNSYFISSIILVIKLFKKLKRRERSLSLISSLLYEYDVSFRNVECGLNKFCYIRSEKMANMFLLASQYNRVLVFMKYDVGDSAKIRGFHDGFF
jgi:hypothetical protein